MKNRVLSILTISILFLCSWGGGQQDDSVSTERAIKMNLQQSFIHYGIDLVQQNRVSQSFDSLMNVLAQKEQVTSTEPLAENTLDQKIIAIARYKAQNPELFDEIASKYIYGVNNPKFRAPMSPQLEPKHITEAYRLVWEYYLLKPVSGSMSAQYDKRAGNALALNNNSSSLVTLGVVYQYTMEKDVTTSHLVIDKRRQLLLAMAEMPSESSLRTMVRLIADEKQKEQGNAGDIWDPEFYLQQLLSGKENLKSQEKWSNILLKFNPNSLDMGSQQIIKNLKLK